MMGKTATVLILVSAFSSAMVAGHPTGFAACASARNMVSSKRNRE
ncbi:hypothetical protein Varpa_3172 [Variovorax paradoxus EPS]|uniref:Lipoprotein n=1 Tax=Variovorax paradoxus (strain EPS) TaxID=595537 RepID=E6V935_VARPE|nr:hypothetical protein Varpa_3172 [Variovorax paradoxus EPS]